MKDLIKVKLSLSTMALGLAISSGAWASNTFEFSGTAILDPKTKESLQFDFITTNQATTVGSFTGYLITGEGAGKNIYTDDTGTQFSFILDNPGQNSFNGVATDNLLNNVSDKGGNPSLALSGGGFSITAGSTQYQLFESKGQLAGIIPGGTIEILAPIGGFNSSAPQVPEAEEWAMLLIGLPLITWVARRKSA